MILFVMKPAGRLTDLDDDVDQDAGEEIIAQARGKAGPELLGRTGAGYLWWSHAVSASVVRQTSSGAPPKLYKKPRPCPLLAECCCPTQVAPE